MGGTTQKRPAKLLRQLSPLEFLQGSLLFIYSVMAPSQADILAGTDQSLSRRNSCLWRP